VKKNSRDEIPEPINTALSNALDKCFTPFWTETQANRVLTNFFEYLKGQNNNPDLTVNLTDRKIILKKNLDQELIKLQPEKLKVYNIKAADTSELSQQIMKLANMPDQLDYSSVPYLKNVRVQQFIKLSQKLFYCFMILPYLLLLLIFYIMYRITCQHSSLKWFGNSMMVAGILSVAAIFAFNGQIEQILVNNISYLVDPLQTLAIDPLILATVFKNDLAIVISIIAGIYCLVGIGITLIGHHIEKNLLSNKVQDLPH
ncbi:MAG: hypothetical protein LLG13_16680, partial [Bacteroidales bacterium]|nr:hypothetical protein [Bacteroidales bacterium]